jgi:hypothetical protein
LIHRLPLVLKPSPAPFSSGGALITFSIQGGRDPLITVEMTSERIKQPIPYIRKMDSCRCWDQAAFLTRAILAAQSIPDDMSPERYFHPLAIVQDFGRLALTLEQVPYDVQRIRVQAILWVEPLRTEQSTPESVHSCWGFISPDELTDFGCAFGNCIKQYDPYADSPSRYDFLRDYC